MALFWYTEKRKRSDEFYTEIKNKFSFIKPTFKAFSRSSVSEISNALFACNYFIISVHPSPGNFFGSALSPLQIFLT